MRAPSAFNTGAIAPSGAANRRFTWRLDRRGPFPAGLALTLPVSKAVDVTVSKAVDVTASYDRLSDNGNVSAQAFQLQASYRF